MFVDCCQVPNQYLMQRLPLSKYLGSILVIWGVCLLCMAFTHRFADLGALRFLLGFWEGTTYAWYVAYHDVLLAS